MITYVKNEYAEKYSLLYQDAVKAVREYYQTLPETDPRKEVKLEDIKIEHLAEYFCYMKDLTEIDMARNELKFTKLPLDENNFVIDLNTRKISIPSNLVDVSVMGDEIAEIVYFEVDRYYDATDLNEQEIIIEWIGADKTKGYSRPYGKDVDLIPGKIVFGWPLSSKITKQNGDVKFAVRFFRADDTPGSSGITYSLSTLEHTIKVKAAIDIDLQDIISKKDTILEDNSLAVLLARATNSKNDNGAQPGTPVIFYIGEEVGADDGLGDVVALPIAHVVYINTSEDDPEGQVGISAGVYADGDGITTGSFWMKFNYDNKEEMERLVVPQDDYNNMSDEEKALVDANFLYPRNYMDYAEITVEEAQAEINKRPEHSAGIIYYERVENEGTTRFVKISREAVLAKNIDEAPVYRLDYTAIFTTVGVYQFAGRVQAGSNTAETNSDYIIVFPPVRAKNVAVAGQKMMVEEEGVFRAALEATKDEFGTEPDNLPPAFVGYEANKEKYPFDGSREWATYKWYRNANVKATIEELNDEDYEPLGATAQAFAVEEEGYYKCGIIGHLNNAVSEEVISEPFRVTRPASRFTLTIAGKNLYGTDKAVTTDVNIALNAEPEIPQVVEYVEEDAVKGLRVEPTLEAPDYMDAFSYQWYRYVCNKENSGEYNVDREDSVKAMKGVYEPDLNGSIAWAADLLQEGATEAEFVPQHDGVYFCVVTNTYNEDKRVVCSPFMAYNYVEQ